MCVCVCVCVWDTAHCLQGISSLEWERAIHQNYTNKQTKKQSKDRQEVWTQNAEHSYTLQQMDNLRKELSKSKNK